MFRRPDAFLIAAVIALGFSGQALAHAHLKTAVPADKAVVATSPSALKLTFSESLNLKFSGIELTGSKGADIGTGDASLSDNGASLSIPVASPLPAGDYQVKWHALSTDGHKTTGSYSFTVKP